MSSAGENTDPQTTNIMRNRILHTLGIYPFLNRSMLHIGIGPAIPTQVWGPILDELVASGEVVRTEFAAQSVAARQRIYEVFHLPNNSYPHPHNIND